MKTFALAVFFTPILFAQDIVVTADRIRSFEHESPSQIKVFTTPNIEKSTDIKDLLKDQTDIQFSQSGPSGGNASLFLRGSDSSHVLVILDGVILNDPSNPNRQFDFGRLSLNNIERIEVLKGSQGLLYGSNAIGGVILLTSKKAKLDPALSGIVEWGSYNTLQTSLDYQQNFNQTSFSSGIDFLKSEGFSAANDSSQYADADGIKRFNANIGIEQTLADLTRISFQYRKYSDESELDFQGGQGGDDPNDYQTTQQDFYKAELQRDWDESESKLIASRSIHKRTLNTVPGAEVKSKGVIDSLTLNHLHAFSESYDHYFAFDFNEESDQLNRDITNTSLFTYGRGRYKNDIFTLGGRLDINETFNEHFTYKVSYLKDIDHFQLKANYSTGFRAPSLNQLYDPTYGNSRLKPETSESYDMGFNWKYEKVSFDIDAFLTNLKNRLSYDPITFINQNYGRARLMGIDPQINYTLDENWRTRVAFTLLSAKNLSTREQLPRRAKVNANWSVFYEYEKHSISPQLYYVGKRNDVDNLGLLTKMNDHFTFDLSYQYSLHQNWELNLKVKNAFDVNYEDVFGYGTGGRITTVGAHYHF